jgi:hypothetical protein
MVQSKCKGQVLEIMLVIAGLSGKCHAAYFHARTIVSNPTRCWQIYALLQHSTRET